MRRASVGKIHGILILRNAAFQHSHPDHISSCSTAKCVSVLQVILSSLSTSEQKSIQAEEASLQGIAAARRQPDSHVGLQSLPCMLGSTEFDCSGKGTYALMTQPVVSPWTRKDLIPSLAMLLKLI